MSGSRATHLAAGEVTFHPRHLLSPAKGGVPSHPRHLLSPDDVSAIGQVKYIILKTSIRVGKGMDGKGREGGGLHAYFWFTCRLMLWVGKGECGRAGRGEVRGGGGSRGRGRGLWGENRNVILSYFYVACHLLFVVCHSLLYTCLNPTNTSTYPPPNPPTPPPQPYPTETPLRRFPQINIFYTVGQIAKNGK